MMQNKIKRALEKNQWELAEREGITIVQSPLLKSLNSVLHAFTTRKGGASQQPLDSFNLGRHWDSEESREDAMKNRKRLCELFEIDSSNLAVPGQQHTTNIQLIDATTKIPPGPSHFPAIDAVATDRSRQPVLLHFADCVPIMLVDNVKRKLCVIHAGWRGTAGSIVKKSVQFMASEMNCDPKDINAAVGPAIGPCCYQTGAEVIEQLKQTVENSDELVNYRNDNPHPDLKAFNAMQLLESGVEQIDVTDWCTACHPEIFYSHRQSGGQTGRQGALACLL